MFRELIKTLFYVGFVLPVVVFAQPRKGDYGISTTISKGFIESHDISTYASSMNIGVLYLVSDQVSLRGEVGFRAQKDTSGNKSSEFLFTADLWYYLHTTENLSTFIGGLFGIGSASDYAGKGTGALSLGAFLGGEYWLSKKFSCFSDIGIMYTYYSVSEKSSWDLYSSATIGLNWYLN